MTQAAGSSATTKAVKISLFALLALALLAAGCLGAQAFWQATRHRYDQPNTGYYRGFVHASFSGTDDEVYNFHFEGETEPCWRWVYSTNLIYRSLRFEWFSFDSQANQSEGKGTLRLPSLAYDSSRGTGILTRAVLSGWLLGGTNGTPRALQSVNAVFGFIEDAGRGTLPAPSHHGHTLQQPVRGYIQHFSLGSGVSGLVYAWICLWLLLVLFFGWRVRRRNRQA